MNGSEPEIDKGIIVEHGNEDHAQGKGGKLNRVRRDPIRRGNRLEAAILNGVKRLAEQGQHLVALGAVREVGHPSGARIPNSWVWVFSLEEWGGRMNSCAS